MKLLSLFLLVIMLSACSDSNSSKTQGRPAAPVAITEIVIKDVPVVIEGVGHVAASASVAIRSRIMGELMEVNYKDGDYVQAGQVLLKLDDRPYKAALQEALARLERDKAQLAKANDDMQRFSRLASKGYTSQEQYQQSQTDAAALRATVMADDAAVESNRLQLSYCTITAPITGRAGALLIDKGNIIKDNADNPILYVDAIEPVYVNFAVPEMHLPAIMEQMKNNNLDVNVTPRGGKTVIGKLTLIDNKVDMRTGTIKLRAEIVNKNHELWPGQFVSVKLVRGEKKNAMIVPVRAVLNGPNGQYVYIIEDKKAKYKNIKVSVEYEGHFVVEEGLKVGDKIVTDGHVRLADNMPVEIVK